MEYHSSDLLLRDLHEGKTLPIYILHGEEPFFLDQVSDFLEDSLLTNAEKDFNLSILYGREVDFKQVLDNARLFPMMSQRRVVLLKEAHQMKEIERLLTYIENPAPQTVFGLMYGGKKIDGRSKWLKAAKKSPRCGVLYAEKVRDYKLGQWLDGYLQRKNRRISPQANNLICEYLGNDLKKLTNEIEKLELNIPESATIGVAEIERFIGISKEFNVFELLSAIGARNNSKAYFIADNLGSNLQRNPMQMITPAFFQYFEKLYITKYASHMNDKQLAGALRVNPFFIKEYKNASHKFSREGLEEIFEIIQDTDARVKGVNNRKTEARELLMEMVGRILLN